MPGLRRNYEELRDLLAELADLPFSFLTEERQAAVSTGLRGIFAGIREDLEKEKLGATNFHACVQALEEASANGLDEEKFSQNLKPFLAALQKNSGGRSHDALAGVAGTFLDRTTAFYSSQAQALSYRETHSEEEIRAHDAGIVGKTMQIYALDYFLFVFWNMEQQPLHKRDIVFSGIGKAPALAEDALSDDMLRKVVYSLYGKSIRKRMTSDYYIYKKAFLPKYNKEAVSAEKIEEIFEALRSYCLSLIDISLEYGAESLEHSLLEPFGKNVRLADIRHKISYAGQ